MEEESPLYKRKVVCDFCMTHYETSRVRKSARKVLRTDSDFCVHFKGYNPDFYTVQVCPTCGYASTENFADGFSLKKRFEFEQKVANNWRKKDFGGERTREEAIITFKLALNCAILREEGFRIICSLLHRIAWLYRVGDDEINENLWLGRALESYQNWFSHEKNIENEVKLLFLIGDLNRRLGKFNEAARWFSMIMNDHSYIAKDPITAKTAREQYANMREEMKAQKQGGGSNSQPGATDANDGN